MTEKIAKSRNAGLGGAVRRSASRGADVAKMESVIRASRVPSIDDLLTGLFKKPAVGQGLLRDVARQDILQMGANATRRIAPTPPPMPIPNRLEKFKLDRFTAGERNPAALSLRGGNPRLAKLMASLGIGAGVTGTLGGLGVGQGVQDAVGSVGNALQSVGDKITGLANTGASLNQSAAPETGSIHDLAPSEGLGGTLWRNAPLLAAGGAGALGLYGLYRNYKKQQEQKPALPSINLMPKTAADRREFAETHPLVAGFLVACSKAGLDELRIREKIAIVCRMDEDIAEEFHAAFTKLGFEIPGPGDSAMTAAMTPPKPPVGQFAAAAPQLNLPKPQPALAGGVTGAAAPLGPPSPRPAGPMPDGSLLADQAPPTPAPAASAAPAAFKSPFDPPDDWQPAPMPFEWTKRYKPYEMQRGPEGQAGLEAHLSKMQADWRRQAWAEQRNPMAQLNREMSSMPAPSASQERILEERDKMIAAAREANQPRNVLGMKPLLPESYRAQIRAFYHPSSPEYKNMPEQDKGLRTTGQVAGAVGLGAGAAAGGAALLPAGAMTIGGGGAAAGTAAPMATIGAGMVPAGTTTTAATGTGLATKLLGTGLLGTGATLAGKAVLGTGKELLQNEAANAAINTATGENPLDPKNMIIPGAVMTSKEKPHNYTAADLPPEDQAILNTPAFRAKLEADAKAQLGPSADPAAVARIVERDIQNRINQQVIGQKTKPEQEALQQELAKTNMPPAQLQEGLAKAEQQGVDPQTEQAGAQNFVKQKAEEAAAGGAPPTPEQEQGWLAEFQAMPSGAKWLLGIGAGIGLLGLLGSFSDEGGGLAGSLALLLGGGLAAGAAAHGGLFGKDIQGATQAITSPMTNLLGNNIQPLSGDQQRMLAAVRGADLDRYQALRSGRNPNLPMQVA